MVEVEVAMPVEMEKGEAGEEQACPAEHGQSHQ
jgi:hypothetical protein